MSFIHGYGPDILLLYGFNGSDAPIVRALIDTIRNVNAYPDMRIMLSGGVFSRAEGLWEEIGADLYAETAAEAVMIAQAPTEKLPTPTRTIKQRGRAEVEEEEIVTI